MAIPQELNGERAGYWSGMPSRLKTRFGILTVYYLISTYVAVAGSWWGIVLLVLPAGWWFLRTWLMDEVLGLWRTNEPGLAGYTLDYVWNASIYVRSLTALGLLAVTLGGLGWLGTIDLREELSKPTLTERAVGAAETATEKAGVMADAASETGKGWFERAKGWFD